MSVDFRLVHLTDPHLSRIRRMPLREFFSKRILGFANLRLKRLKQHSNALAYEAARKAKELGAHHILITGDLSNLAFAEEYAEVSSWLKSFERAPEKITVVPGNHDAYLKKLWPDGPFWEALNPYCLSDAFWAESFSARFPVVRDRGKVRIIGLSTAIPSPPLMAWGEVGRGQLQGLKRALIGGRRERKTCLIALHHPPQTGVTRTDNGLRDAHAFRSIVLEEGAGLVLHGHMHRAMRGTVAGPGQTSVPVWGTGSASLVPTPTGNGAQFRVLDFGKEGRLLETALYLYDSLKGGFVRMRPDPLGG